MPPRRTPNVGVMIAAYRAADTIGRAVRSALDEPETAEVLVVDDASGDDTPDRALAEDDGTGRLKVVRQPSNAGPAAARNKALELLSTDWVCVLDADDYFLPGRLGALLALSDDWDMVADALIRTKGEEPACPDGPPQPEDVIDLATFVDRNVGRKGLHRQELGFMKPLTRRSFLVDHGLKYDEGLRLGEDYCLYASMLAQGARLLTVGPAGYVAVEREDSLSGRHEIADLRALRDCDHQLANSGLSMEPAARRALKAHYVSLDKRLQWRLMIEAVKARDIAGAARTFTSAPVGLHLLSELGGQLWSRGLRGFRSHRA